MDLKSIKAKGANLTSAQQASFYYARKRRRGREQASASEFKDKSVTGVAMRVTLTTA